MSRRTVILLLGYPLLLLVATADLVWLYPQLPERLATKFGAGGGVTGWSTRAGWLTVQMVSLGLTAGLMVGLRFGLRWIPARFINLPHREFWLAPGRAEASLAALGDYVLTTGLGLLAFLVGLQHLAMRANLGPEPRLGGAFWVLLAGLLAVLGGGLVWLYWRFWRPG